MSESSIGKPTLPSKRLVYIGISCPHGELNGMSSQAFLDKFKAEKWCKQKNIKEGYVSWVSHEYYLQEFELVE